MTETETTTAPTVNRDDLGEVAKILLAEVEQETTKYNALAGQIEAATGDQGKAVHNLRETSEDPEVLKFRDFVEALDAKREAAVQKIHAYIEKNLLQSSSMTPEEVEEAKTSLKAQRKEINELRGLFLSRAKIEGADSLLPEIKGARKSAAAPGSGAPKPRVASITVDGEEMSHETTNKDGETVVKSTFTDAVKFLSDKHKVKVQTSDLHAGYFENGGPDSATPVEYVVSVTDKDGKSHNHKVVVINSK